MKWFIFTLVVLAIMGCKIQKQTKAEKYRYQYGSSGCTTGVQEFEGKEDWCAGLIDESRNQGCARETRLRVYRESCSSDQPDTIAENPTPTVPGSGELSL